MDCRNRRQAAPSSSDEYAPPLKRSRTSLPSGPAPMYHSYSMPSGQAPSMSHGLSFGSSFLVPIPEQSSSTPYYGSQTMASTPASYVAADYQVGPVYEDPGMDPTAFLETRGCILAQPMPVSLAVPSSQTSGFDFDCYPHHGTAPSLGSSDTMTDALTLETTSSGQVHDFHSQSPDPSFGMVHNSSQSSFMESSPYEGGFSSFDKNAPCDNDLLRYTGSMLNSYWFAAASAGLNADVPRTMPCMGRSMSTQSFATTVDLPTPTIVPAFADNGLSQQQFKAEPMSRGPSNTSSRSNASARVKSSLQRYLDNGKTPLKPKVSLDQVEKTGNRPPLANFADVPAHGGKAIRAKNEQPKTPKLYCSQCEAYPKGFRGEHELRRHQQNKHSSNPKRWICCTPRENNTTSAYKPFQSLASCKKCSDKRMYAQDYNAAEHLRRVHFTPKAPKAPRKGSKNVSGRVKEESHGDSAGRRRSEEQLQITMEELKKWMMEVDAPVDANGASAANDQDNDGDEFPASENTGYDDGASHGQGNGYSTSQGTSHGADFDICYSAGCNTGGSQYTLSPDIGCQSPQFNPRNPDDCSPAVDPMCSPMGICCSGDEPLPNQYSYHQYLDGPVPDLLGCGVEAEASQSFAFGDEINTFHYAPQLLDC